jgi:DUF4097 and DUF4098 domain-containing protein YvlB
MTLGPLFLLAAMACDADPTGPGIGPGPIDIDVDPPEHEASASFAQDVALDGQTRVRLKGVSGQIQFQGEDGPGDLQISGTRRVSAGSMQDAREHLDMLNVKIHEGDEEIVIETEQPRNDARSYQVDYTVRLPRGMTVHVEAVNGSVRLGGMAQDAEVDLVNGAIEASLTLPVGGSVDLFTVNGDIDLDLQRDVSAQFSATLTHGQITVFDLPIHDRVATAHSLTGCLGDGSGVIRLALVNGDIEVRGR